MMTHKLQNFDEEISMLFQALFDDLGNGIKEVSAGWRSSNQLSMDKITQRELLSSGLIEINLRDEIRLNFKDSRINKELRKMFSLQHKQLIYFLNNQEIIKSDNEKVMKAQDLLNKIAKILSKSPENWAFIIALGWWKMLESSGMPAPFSDVLNEGFSPKAWTIKATRSSPQLALSVARKWNEISDFKEVVNFIEKMKVCNIENLSLPPSIVKDDVEKIRKILRWEDIEIILTESNVKMCAFSWSSFFLLQCANLFPISDEIFLKLSDVIWNTLEELVGENQSNLISDLEGTLKKLTEEEITWASDILRLPEVI
ncbi:MAG: hypothetical protein KAX04_04650 [Methanomicrobia archaeon]|nr:hypothetical protein [Methanomicrobia archaeon]